MTPEEMQPYLNIALNSGAVSRLMGALTVDEYTLVGEHVRHAIEAAYEAGAAAERQHAAQLCDKWARIWNDEYERSSRRTKGRVMYHLIGSAVWAIGRKIADKE